MALSFTLTPSMRKSATLIVNLAQRDLKARYKRSLLGWFWSFMNPLTTVVVYGFVFGVVYGAEAPPTDNGNAENFGLYLFTGLIVWSVFTGVVNGSMGWLIGVSDLRKKIYFPTETALLGGAAANAVQTLLEAIVLIVIMVVLANISWTFVFLFVALAQVMAFGLGVGFIVSVFNARYRDTQYLIGILLNVAFFLVPIVYTQQLLDDNDIDGVIRVLLDWNPPALFVEIARDAMYFLEVPQWNRLLAATAWGVITFSIGWVYFRDQSMAISEEP